MALQTLDISFDSTRLVLTDIEHRFIAAAGTRAERLKAMHPDITTLLLSDPTVFGQVLRVLLSERLLRGISFCEWGSGIGVMSGLAAMNGLKAYGIEKEQLFMLEAESLSRDFMLDAVFVCGSFVPRQLTSEFRVVGTYGATQWDASEDVDVYRVLGKSCSEMDLIYAYPWPREVGYYEALFDAASSSGSILWLFSPGNSAKLLRKI